jgi:hypothetical protein
MVQEGSWSCQEWCCHIIERQVYDESLDDKTGVVPDFEDDGIIQLQVNSHSTLTLTQIGRYSIHLTFSPTHACFHNQQVQHEIHFQHKCTYSFFNQATVLRNSTYWWTHIQSNSKWKGDEWYDWISVHFPDSDGEGLSVNCIGRLLEFILYKSKDALLTYTYKNWSGQTTTSGSKTAQWHPV